MIRTSRWINNSTEWDWIDRPRFFEVFVLPHMVHRRGGVYCIGECLLSCWLDCPPVCCVYWLPAVKWVSLYFWGESWQCVKHNLSLCCWRRLFSTSLRASAQNQVVKTEEPVRTCVCEDSNFDVTLVYELYDWFSSCVHLNMLCVLFNIWMPMWVWGKECIITNGNINS